MSVGWTKLRCHNPVAGVRTPERSVCEASVTVTDVASNVTTQPASHSCPMDSREEEWRAGTMWTRRAARGRLGRLSSASWVEYIMVPLGLAMPIGLEVGRLLTTAAETVQKCAVLPESAIPSILGGIIVGGGGPTMTEDKLKPVLVSLEVTEGMSWSGVGTVGSPPCQLLVGLEAAALALRALAMRRGRPDEIVLFPPCMLKAVAVSW